MEVLFHQEPDRVDGRRVAWISAAAGAVAALFVGAAGWLAAGGPPPPQAPWDQVGLTRQTPILADPSAVDRRAAAERALHGWAWVDRDRGVVHVPVEVARELVAARGAR